MREHHVELLACPTCQAGLRISAVECRVGPQIVAGTLTCVGCGRGYPIVRGIPRFVPARNYAASFGLEWTVHARTQYDSYSGTRLSEERFFRETGWGRNLAGQRILEVGSGSGRFTEQAASTGATVASFDYSHAVEVNYQANGHRENVLIVQGSIYQIPFRRGAFDKLFCFGVLQHTPNVRRAFFALPPMLRSGGELVCDVYKKTLPATLLGTKYYVRPITRRLKPDRLYRLTRRWVDLMWPVASVVRHIPRIGPSLNWRLLVADYSGAGLRGPMLKEWAYLDTFDMLSPRYDSPQTIGTVRAWLEEAGLTDISVGYAFNNVVGRGRQPETTEARQHAVN